MSGNEILEVKAEGQKNYMVPREITALDYLDEALALFKPGEYDQILELCDKAIEINPRLPKIYRVMALAHYQKGNLDKALEIWDKAWNFRMGVLGD